MDVTFLFGFGADVEAILNPEINVFLYVFCELWRAGAKDGQFRVKVTGPVVHVEGTDHEGVSAKNYRF